MLRISDLSDEEIRELLFQPMTEEEAKRLLEINEQDRWLLALNLQEMGQRESDSNYDPADDPTCVLIIFGNEEV